MRSDGKGKAVDSARERRPSAGPAGRSTPNRSQPASKDRFKTTQALCSASALPCSGCHREGKKAIESHILGMATVMLTRQETAGLVRRQMAQTWFPLGWQQADRRWRRPSNPELASWHGLELIGPDRGNLASGNFGVVCLDGTSGESVIVLQMYRYPAPTSTKGAQTEG
jgi:hypothetical protein